MEKQDNATEFIENLILNAHKDAPWRDLEFAVNQLSDLLIAAHSETHVAENEVRIKFHDCFFTSKSDKCDHWVYDEETEQHLNELTGEYSGE